MTETRMLTDAEVRQIEYQREIASKRPAPRPLTDSERQAEIEKANAAIAYRDLNGDPEENAEHEWQINFRLSALGRYLGEHPGAIRLITTAPDGTVRGDPDLAALDAEMTRLRAVHGQDMDIPRYNVDMSPLGSVK